jgi:hypothetical protein
VDSLFNSITLPLADESFNGKKNKLMEETKAAILCLASDHLRQKHELLKTELKQANPLDKERAGKLASSYSTKQFGKRLPEQLLQEKIAEAISLVGTSSNETETEIVITGPTQTPSTPRGRSESATPRNVTHSVSSSPEPQIKKGKFLTEASGKSADENTENTEVSAMDTIVPQVNDRTESSPEVNDKTFSVNKDVEETKEPRDLTEAIKIYRRIHGLHTKISDLLGKREDVEEDLERSKHNLVQANTTLKGLEIRKQTKSVAYKTKKAQILAIQLKIKNYQDSLEAIDDKLNDAEATDREVRVLFTPYKDIEGEVERLLLDKN